MEREQCWVCRRPKDSCLCPQEPPIPVRTKIVLLMHDREWRHQRTGTGRITCLNLEGAQIIHGMAFDEHPRVRELIDSPDNACFLLFPGRDSINLSEGAFPSGGLAGKTLVVFLIDATWDGAKAVLRNSPRLLELPRLMFTPSEPSKFIIKRQPKPECLSTVEATHQLLLALEQAGLDSYPDKERLLSAFYRMRDYQIRRANETPNPRRRGRKEDAAE